MNKIISTGLLVAVVVGGVSFYGGMKYGQANLSATSQAGDGQGRNRQGGGPGGGGFGGGRNGGGFTDGNVIAKDDKSITIQMRDGGSKIVFYSGTTDVSKFVSGTSDDRQVGKSVMVSGAVNSDGSVTAQSVQIRPPMPSASPSASSVAK